MAVFRRLNFRFNPVFRFVLSLTLLNLLSAPAGQCQEESTFALHVGTLLKKAGESPLKDQTVLIEGGLIASILPGFHTFDDNPALEIIDLRQAFVMPGLIDTHVHLSTDHRPESTLSVVKSSSAELAIIVARNAESILMAGFTTVMDLGNGWRQHEQAVYAVRDAISQGALPGPEILAAGSPIAAHGFARTGRFNDAVEFAGGPEGTCQGPESCRYQVLEQLYRGADFINVYPTGSLLQQPSPQQTLTNDELSAIAETADLAGVKVIADGGNSPVGAAGINRAIEYGFDIIDTVTFPDNATFRLLNRNDGYFAPHVYALEAAVGDTPETLEKGSMGWLPRSILEQLYALKQQTPSALVGYREKSKLILASDSGVFPHGDNGNELLAYSKLGITPADTLAAATINAATAFGIEARTGHIAPGLEADLVAFRESPLENMGIVAHPELVISDGRIFYMGKH
ncbi:amidohydrolase family protein [Luminiphilus syltensis]|nr:amidohydrolase family protein [Luminiphilus syltensis]